MTKKIQLIIIDDETVTTNSLKIILQSHAEYGIEIFNCPIKALDRLYDKHFDVISLDHRMPKLTGMTILKELRNNEGPNQETPILLITGHRDDIEAVPTELMENLLFLEKPVEIKRYLTHIRLAWQMSIKQKLSKAS